MKRGTLDIKPVQKYELSFGLGFVAVSFSLNAWKVSIIRCSQAGNKKNAAESETAFRRTLAIDLFQGLFLNICCM
ncbi:unnamed protein product [Coffea canephora]|uniref:Uncharacterized protein n=1 Tax=Coffea canephora TaxID=49390 RepID=A0A068VCB9_COFCA|nr:unnamed protein product [Coffea canephora]